MVEPQTVLHFQLKKKHEERWNPRFQASVLVIKICNDIYSMYNNITLVNIRIKVFHKSVDKGKSFQKGLYIDSLIITVGTHLF